MKIENIEILELFRDTIFEYPSNLSYKNSRNNLVTCDCDQSFTLTNLLNHNKSLMSSLAQEYQTLGIPMLSQIVLDIEKAIINIDLSQDSEKHTRMLEYVYPVV